jgi:hypothetical protein
MTIMITNKNNMERIEITQELRKEIHTEIDLANKGNGYGDGFKYVPFFGKFTIKYNKSEKEFDSILDALKFYNSTKGSKAFWYRGELIDCQ